MCRLGVGGGRGGGHVVSLGDTGVVVPGWAGTSRAVSLWVRCFVLFCGVSRLCRVEQDV